MLLTFLLTSYVAKRMTSRIGTARKLAVGASWVPLVSAGCSAIAYLGALVIALYYHQFEPDSSKFGYSGEWLYPVSQLVDGSYHTRSFVQIMLAIGLGPKLLLTLLWAVVYSSRRSPLSATMAIGLTRCLFHVLSVYVTISDSHSCHDMARIGYLVMSGVWYLWIYRLDRRSVTHPEAAGYRKRILGCMAVIFLLMAHYFSEHRMSQVVGAYSKNALCEWAIVFLDILFELSCAPDFENITLTISPRKHALLDKV